MEAMGYVVPSPSTAATTTTPSSEATQQQLAFQVVPTYHCSGGVPYGIVDHDHHFGWSAWSNQQIVSYTQSGATESSWLGQESSLILELVDPAFLMALPHTIRPEVIAHH